MTSKRPTAARPPIQICESDAERISDLALDLEPRQPQIAALLLAEINRAKVVPDGKLPSDVAAMQSTIRFSDEASGTERTLQLVYPHEADIEQGRISILSLVGAGLLGLRPGQSISWPDRGEHERRLTVIEVTRG